MNRDNVVPFVSSVRGALARRGAPDKLRMASAGILIECPSCAARLCLDAGTFAGDPELWCMSCNARFSLPRGEAAAD